MQHMGWLALDIDGTLTHSKYSIPHKVITYLKKRCQEGWKIIILTGRSYPFAMPSVKDIDFPYILSTQNGSIAIHMPKKTTIFKNFFHIDNCMHLEKKARGYDLAFIVYGDDYKCYYKKSGKYNSYIDFIVEINKQEKVGFDDFTQINELKYSPLIKIVGPYAEAMKLQNKLEQEDLCESTLIKDPFHDNFYILLLTKKGVSKGTCIEKILSFHSDNKIVIAAGNDRNDISMFKRADISVAMSGAPEDVLHKADIIAPPCSDNGIIDGLDMAIAKAYNIDNTKLN